MAELSPATLFPGLFPHYLGAWGGILTFSEKTSQIPYLHDNIIGQKYQKPHPGASKGGQNDTL